MTLSIPYSRRSRRRTSLNERVQITGAAISLMAGGLNGVTAAAAAVRILAAICLTTGIACLVLALLFNQLKSIIRNHEVLLLRLAGFVLILSGLQLHLENPGSRAAIVTYAIGILYIFLLPNYSKRGNHLIFSDQGIEEVHRKGRPRLFLHQDMDTVHLDGTRMEIRMKSGRKRSFYLDLDRNTEAEETRKKLIGRFKSANVPFSVVHK